MTSWKTYRLGDLCDTISDTYKGCADEVVLINTSDVLEGKCLNHTKEPNRNLKGQFKKTFKKYDILYSEIRPANKRFAYIDFDATNYIASTKLMVLRHNEKIEPLYFYYILQSQSIIDELQMLAESRSGTFPQITFAELSRLEVKLPNREVQRQILEILGAIDDKIENNRRINDNLEQQAQALYKQWFVDNRSDDWEIKKLSDFFDVKTGKKDANFSTTDGEYPFFTCSQDVLKAPDYSFDGAAILVAGNGDFNVKRYIGKFEAYQRTYVLIPFDRKYHSFLYLTIKHYLQEITGGSRGSVIKFITKGNIADFEVTLPQINIDDKLAVLDSLYQTIDRNTAENHNLATLRDTLLPKLMNGEIKL